uniref:Putative secreted protein n=1 Tax=Ixodes ricinus TaxID=34613 RepID=A0A090XB41_IXORI
MLLLKLTLVVLISVIGERALCTDSGPAPSAKEIETAPETLPQELLIHQRDSDGCEYDLLPYFDESDGMDNTDAGFLTVNCTKSCPGEIKKTDVNGNPCVASWRYSDPTTITVQEGSCKEGFCNPCNPPKPHTITLGEEEEEAEGEEEEEGKGKE